MTLPQLQAVGVIAGLFLFLMLLRSIYGRRHAIATIGRWMFIALSFYAVTFAIALRITADFQKALLYAFVVEIVAGILWRPRRRSRHLPARHSRVAIERFQRSTGKKYNPRKHEIDHVIPYSRWGSNTADNLRVVDRDRNREKSARSTWWDVFSRS